MDFTLAKILSTDGLDQNGIKLLRDSGMEVIEEKMSKQQLIEKLSQFDAVIVRSATTIDGDIIRAVSSKEGNRLRVIARAGTGVDNIDMVAATECGMLVINTPAANTLSAAEHTFALMCSLSRKIPQAYMTMQQGQWDRKSFMGTELFGKTLAIIGLGRIGREVASRAQAFGMKTIGYDPIVTEEEARSFKVEAMTLNKMWPLADYITVHVPLIPQTENLINLEVFRQCKKTVQVINCSRGGIINEEDLLKALESGLCSGAALDVFIEEPTTNHNLVKHPKVISTPHLGASTKEAQFRVAMEIAENLVTASNGTKFCGLVNGHIVGMLQNQETQSWKLLLSMLRKSFTDSKKVLISYDDVTTFSKQRGFEAFLKGCLTMLILGESTKTNLINYKEVSKNQHLDIELSKRSSSNPLNTPSLEITIEGKSLDVSVWKNQVYLTKYNDEDLEQPVLLKHGCHLLITSCQEKSSHVLGNQDLRVVSYNVVKNLYVFVIQGDLNTKISESFDFIISF